MFLCRRLDSRHTLCKNTVFPKRLASKKRLRYRAVLGVGGNVGDTLRTIMHVWVYLGRLKQIERRGSGAILRNPPFGYLEQRDFDNTVFEIATSLQPRALLRLVWRIEKRFGRKRSFPNAPRTLDLDIIFFGNRKVGYPELTIPHPHWRERPSVTIPMKTLSSKRNKVRKR